MVSTRGLKSTVAGNNPQISAEGDPKWELFTFSFSETLRAPLPQASRSSQMVQNLRILVQTRPSRPGGVVNKTQPKEEQTREGLPMKPWHIRENRFRSALNRSA